MKVYIQSDLEGVAGVTFFENTSNHSPAACRHSERIYHLLTGEINAAVGAAFDAGADEVVVNDSHGSGYNIFFEELDPRCEIIHGRNFSGPHWLPELDSTFDAMVLIGAHAKGGTRNAITPHSLYELNDGEDHFGEPTMAAAIAGHHGVPTVCVSGDDKVTTELAERIPGIEVAAVKKALSAYQARSLMPARAQDLIAEKVREGLNRRGDIQPYSIPGPVKLNLLDAPDHVPPLKPLLETPVEADNIEDAFLELQRLMPWTKFPVELPDGFQYP